MISLIKKYFQKHIQEIANDKALRWYGGLLAFGQVLTCFEWIVNDKARYLSDAVIPTCWPFFENCFQYRFFNLEEIQILLALFLFFSIITTFLFFLPRLSTAGYWCLIGINILKTFFYVQDFHLRMNQHYMLYWMTFIFLFLPNKRNLLKYAIVCIYFWASTLKWNNHWISGNALYGKPLFIPQNWIPVACVYVIVLESIIAFGLLSRSKWIYWISFAQFLLFHLVSWSVVGFFYPMLLFVLITIFPLTHIIKPKKTSSRLTSQRTQKINRITTSLYITIFSFFQLIPYMIPGNAKITGEGRLFALHMFDSYTECDGSLVTKFKDGSLKEIKIPLKEEVFRIRCDPIVYWNQARAMCRNYDQYPDFDNVHLYYEARERKEGAMKPLVNIQNFCDSDYTYMMWRSNPWIIKN